jgi:tetratricopeptide (TPR) repeat protein
MSGDTGKGMEAMASRRANGRLAQLWQLPLLLISLGLFGYAAYLFIDPKPGLTIDDKIEIARRYLVHERPEAAIEQLNTILTTEKLTADNQGKVHLLLAEALEAGQQIKKISIPANHQRIVEQTRLALARGIIADAEVHRRLAESYEVLGRPTEALDNYRRAIALDNDRAFRLSRKVIELQLSQDDRLATLASIDEYLQSHDLTNSEQAWAMGEKAQLLIDEGRFTDARLLLNEALQLEMDPVAQGQINYRLGYCTWKLGDADEAERYLRVARDQLRVKHPLDADASYVLGEILQQKLDPAQAISFYQVVLVSHPDSPVAPLARLGRGICRIMQNEDDPGLTDLHDLVDEISRKSSRAKYRQQAVAGLKRAAELLSQRGNYQGALEVLAYEQSLHQQTPGEFFARLAAFYERRAEQVEKTVELATGAEQVRRSQQVRELRGKAGDACIAYSQALTLIDDKGYADAMWKGIELYDRAGDGNRVIAALELFVAERPEDALAPEALLRLGRAYQASGAFDRAIASYQRNQFRYPHTLAASKSAVPLAQAYIAKGPSSYSKAESVLVSVIDNNPLLTPDSDEFRQALFELAQLQYRTSRFEESVARLEEFVERYPDDDRKGQLLFLMADSYRKSATLLEAKLAAASATASAGDVGVAIDPGEAADAKRERLTKSRRLFDQVIEQYRASPSAREIDQLYLKLSHFYRADCLYDLGEYADAIKLYDAAAFRYQDDPSALAAYVQIVNAYCALGRIDEAKTANERAKWLLRRIPQESFTDGSFSMPKHYWEQWLKWTSDAGMW